MEKDKPLIEYNYHTHTSRCGHASGLEEEYVLNAIKLGIKRLGFSDHIFLEGISQKRIRGDYSELDDYLSTVNNLKEKYKDQIEIIVGFEAEYLPDYLTYYQNLLDSHKIDYLILGQHCYQDETGLHFYFSDKAHPDSLIHYVDDVVAGLKTGLFKYVAHPDLFYYSCRELDRDLLVKESRRIIETALELDIPIEINMCGMNKKSYDPQYNYPSDFFNELLSQYPNNKVVLGIDAHSPEAIDIDKIKYALDFIKKHNLNLIKDYEIKSKP